MSSRVQSYIEQTSENKKKMFNRKKTRILLEIHKIIKLDAILCFHYKFSLFCGNYSFAPSHILLQH